MIKFIVDRIEENFVLCENFETHEIEDFENNMLPENIKEGDILIYDETLDRYYIDVEGTEVRKKEIIKKMNEIWE